MWGPQEERPAKRVLERIVEDLRENPVALADGGAANLTFSGGTCRWRAGEDARGLLARVDGAMYLAKAAGGDTVVHLD